MTKVNRILRLDASARKEGSITRSLADETLERLAELTPVHVVSRDIAAGLPFLEEDWINANFTPADQRSAAQIAKLQVSTALVEEVAAADTLVIAAPIYNFNIPATLKAWIDMTARVGLSFKYTENGPIGLLTGKRAIILIASGGTEIGSPIDFATPYLKHALAFIGITDIEFIAVDAVGQEVAEKRQKATDQIKALKAA